MANPIVKRKSVEPSKAVASKSQERRKMIVYGGSRKRRMVREDERFDGGSEGGSEGVSGGGRLFVSEDEGDEDEEVVVRSRIGGKGGAKMERKAKMRTFVRGVRRVEGENHRGDRGDDDDDDDEVEEGDDAEEEATHERRKIPAKRIVTRSRRSEPLRARFVDDEERGTGGGGEKPAKKARRSEPVRGRAYEELEEGEESQGLSDDEYEDDHGQTASQQFLQIIAHNQRKNNATTQEMNRYFTQFKKMLVESEEEFKKQLREASATALQEEANFLTDFKKAFTIAAPISNSSKKITSAKEEEGLDFASLHKESMNIIRDAMTVVEQFENLKQSVAKIDIKSLLANDWDNEDQAIADLLGQGRSVGVAKFRARLNREKEEVARPGKGEKSIVGRLFYQAKTGEEPLRDDGWGEVARKQEKGVKKLVKALGR